MFTKLRSKFVILNMSITSLVMMAAFATIYFITYNNIHSEIQKKLNSRSEIQTTLQAPGFPAEVAIKAIELPESPAKKKNMVLAPLLPSDDCLIFTIEVDPNGKVLQINSFIDMPDEVYYKAAELAWSKPNSNEPVTLVGRKWQYAITQEEQVIFENGQEYITRENKYQILYIDVTEYNKTLWTLLTTLVCVGLVTLIVIFMISLYFAERAIKPIAKAWEQQKQFIADASHELKTPLSIINANYDALMANKEETINTGSNNAGKRIKPFLFNRAGYYC